MWSALSAVVLAVCCKVHKIEGKVFIQKAQVHYIMYEGEYLDNQYSSYSD